ncbi:MAG: iron ABC transporter substrate-binding protein [Spirochaetes bacterium]|nr:MAG: iron ABC transporter substrate-binding protein [Spirochaetota bacterium]
MNIFQYLKRSKFMKKTQKILVLCLIIGLAAGSFAFTSCSRKIAGTDYSPEMDTWAQKAQLGKYDKKQDWDEIIALAKEEGEVIIYSSSSRMAAVGNSFNKIYPDIKVTSHDLGSVKTFEKTVGEQEAGIFNADIITTGGSGNFIYDLIANNRVVNFVPSMFADRIAKENKEPALVRIMEAIVFMYNTEVNDAPPITNLWELTTEAYRGKVVIKDPLASLSNLMGVATITQHADEMKKAYKDFTGEDIVLSEGVPDAGYEFLYRLLHNDLIILDSGSKTTGASGKKGQTDPPVSITSFTYLRYNGTKEYVNGLVYPVEPADGVIYPTYTAIAARAPHPNAAKLFTAYMLGDPSITLDTVIEKPFTEGKSLEILQGLAPYYEIGSVSPRDDVPLPEGGEAWNEMNMWVVDPEYMWYDAPKVQDFWIKESAR